jgi:hypothetical protein
MGFAPRGGKRLDSSVGSMILHPARSLALHLLSLFPLSISSTDKQRTSRSRATASHGKGGTVVVHHLSPRAAQLDQVIVHDNYKLQRSLQLPPLAPDRRTGARPCVSLHAFQHCTHAVHHRAEVEECPRPLRTGAWPVRVRAPPPMVSGSCIFLFFYAPGRFPSSLSRPLFNRPAAMHEPTQPPLY